MSLSIPQIYAQARAAGLSGPRAVIATAIALAESGGRPDAIGDRALETASWGPSVGLWQVRSVRSQSGTGQSRDATQLESPTFNAQSMATISHDGSNFGAWSTYTSGAYRSHLSEVQAAIGSKGGANPRNSSVGANVSGAEATRGAILSVSRGWLGVPYFFGGASRSRVDCSGLTMNVYKEAAGISLPHNSALQSLKGKSVSQANARPGDLVFFGQAVITHVGIWLGGGMVRHAPHPGAVVRDESLSSIASTVPLAGFRNYLGDAAKASTTPSTAADLNAALGTDPTLTAPAATGSSRRNAQNVMDWNPLHWPGDLEHAAGSAASGAVDGLEDALMAPIVVLSLLGLGAGLVIVGAASLALKATNSTPIPPVIPV